MTIHSAFVLPHSDKSRLHTHPKRTPLAKFLALASMFGLLMLYATTVFAQRPAIPGVTTLKLKSDVLGEERTILVRTPTGYETSNQRYP
ncbi:MAG TPA: hypothetical protein VFP47_20485, partial [Pyrinomonadaceae bacterium]|nr:hypothetical protein [Pyrinomonadaceae bacterium]